MDPATSHRLFNITDALNHPVTRWLLISLLAVLVISPVVIAIISRAGIGGEKLRKDLWDRYKSWLMFIPMMALPVFLGAAATIAAVTLLALACYREFARATGLFRDWIISAVVVLG